MGLLVKLSGDPARQAVQFHAVQICAGKGFRQQAEKVSDAAGRFQDIPRLKAHPPHSIVNGLDNTGAGIVGAQCGRSGGGVFLRGEKGLQFRKFLCPRFVVFVKRRGQAAPAHIVGQYLLFRPGSQTALRLDLLQGTDSRYVVLIFGFLTASAKALIGNVEIVQFRANVQFLKYHIKGSGVYPSHHLRGHGRFGCGRLCDPAAVDLHLFRFRGGSRLVRRFQHGCQQLLRLTTHVDQVLKIKVGQFIVDHFPQGLVPALFDKLVIQHLCDTEIQQIDLHLNFVPFILGSGVGDADMLQIRKISAAAAILRVTEILYQPLGFLQCVSFGMILAFRFIGRLALHHIFNTGCLLKFPPLCFLYILTDIGDRFLPENGIAVFLRHFHIQEADFTVGVVDAVHLHAPSVNGQFLTQGDVLGNIPLLNDLIGGVRAALEIGTGQHHALAMLQQLFERGLPCTAFPSGGCLSQTGNIQYRGLCSQGGGRFFGILAIEHHKLPYLDADEFIRVLGF